MGASKLLFRNVASLAGTVALGFLLTACRSQGQKEQIVVEHEVASSFGERQEGVLEHRPPARPAPADIGTTEKAVGHFSSTLNHYDLIKLASAYLERGEFLKARETAVAAWNSVTSLRQPNVLNADLRQSPQREIALLLAVSGLSIGEEPQSVRLLEKLILANREWEAPYLALGDHYLKRRSFYLGGRTARAGLDRVREPSPRLYALAVRALRAQGVQTEALQILKQGQGRYPEDAGLMGLLGLAEFDEGRFELACARFQQAYEREPSHALIAHNHAVCLTRAGETEKAEAVLRLSMAQHPQVAHLRMLAGVVAKSRGNLAEARKAWGDYLVLAAPMDPLRASVEVALAELSLDESALAEMSLPVSP